MNILHSNYLFDSCLYITLFLHTNLPLSPLPLPFLLFLLSNPFLLSLPFSTPYQETTNHLHTQKRINLYKKTFRKKQIPKQPTHITCKMMCLKASGCPPPQEVPLRVAEAARMRKGSVKQKRRSQGLRAWDA